MRITKIHLKGFGKFQGMSLDFKDGLNVIYGKNEAGKSTTHTFIKSMLFGLKKNKLRGKIDLFSKYTPWENKETYEGTLDFTYEGKNYQIYRTFEAENPILTITDIDNNTTISNPETFLSKVLCNLNASTFDNTISIGQLKVAQDSTMVSELHKIIANINTSGNLSINTIEAINMLKKKKDDFTLDLISDATLAYNKKLADIKTIEKELQNKGYNNKLTEYLDKQKEAENKIKENSEKIEIYKRQIADNTTILNRYGFYSKHDIENIKDETEKLYMDYVPIKNSDKSTLGIIFDIFGIFISIFLITLGTLMLVVTYPNVASILNANTVVYNLEPIKNIILNSPIHPAPLIGIIFCFGFVMMLLCVLALSNNSINIKKSEEIQNILTEVLKNQIDSHVINDTNMVAFREHMRDMLGLFKNSNLIESDITLLTKKNSELRVKIDDYKEKIDEQKRIQYDVEGKFNQLNKLREEIEILKRGIEKNDELNKEIDSLDLAIDTLSRLSNQIHVMFGTHLNKKASIYMQGLTMGKYTSLNVDDSLNVTLNYDNKVIPLSQVSTGTMDQIYLAMRLASTDIIKGDNEPLPLLFDDSFAMYDNERIEYALKYLSENIKAQILIFTCHTREQALLAHNNIPFNKISI